MGHSLKGVNAEALVVASKPSKIEERHPDCVLIEDVPKNLLPEAIEIGALSEVVWRIDMSLSSRLTMSRDKALIFNFSNPFGNPAFP